MSAPHDVSKNLSASLDLAEFGMGMQRQNLARSNPGLDGSQIDALFRSWLLDRPPDAPGVLRELPS